MGRWLLTFAMDITSDDCTATVPTAAAPTAPKQRTRVLRPTEEDNGTSLVPPRSAFRWILHNAITSDTELAILSNVCRRWRELVSEYVMELTERVDVAEEWNNRATTGNDTDSPIRYLLLPSMMRAFETKPHNKSEAQGIRSLPDKDHFCVAWFASEGIQQLPWSQLLREDDMLEKILLQVHDTAASRDLTDSVLDTNHSVSEEDQSERVLATAAMEAATTRQLQHHAAAVAAAAATRGPTTFQWQRKAKGVVLSNEWRGYREPIQVLQPFGYALAFVSNIFSTLNQRHRINGLDTDEGDDEYFHATFAVRGATVARPESYCLCMDRVTESSDDHATRMQRLKDRKDLRRSVFPRVVQRGVEMTTTTAPPVVQFLNVDKGSAVTMMTPALECGTLREPFTIFLVGIATEDGCFLSGLRRRFEVGHLYPKDQLADITDSSAVCIFTEDSSPPPADENRHRIGDMDDEDDDDDMIEESSDDDDSDDMPRCNCVFDGVTEKLSVMEDQDERHGRLVRGVLGPGTWHCYTFIVDGVDSMIRIDGLDEPMEVHQNRNSPALLDGLTLGSDHCFGTSLCCGQGSPGEGEGAIAEVAVFGGRMCERDITTLERHLMSKHAIPPQTMGEPWLEDDFHRQARAMFHLVGNPRGKQVPLKYFAKSPNVAWKVYHPVTGNLIRKERIGVKGDESSSTFG